jgi:hypothetical protein
MIYQNLQNILDHYYQQEQSHYEASGHQENHIFQDLEEIKAWLESQAPDIELSHKMVLI